MRYLFTSESVTEGHRDKICDQISDAVLDALLAQDKHSRVACETFVTTGLAMVGGEITTNGYIEVQDLVREVIRDIGYTKAEYRFDAGSCSVISTIHSQSPDIVRWSPKLVWPTACAGLIWLAILIGMTMTDFLTRGWLPPSKGW